MINDRLMNIREFTNIYGESPDTVLVYNVIFNSVFRRIQNIVDLNNTEILFRDMTVGEIERKTFSLIAKPKPQCTVLNYWELEIDHFDKSDNMIWIRSFLCTKESYLRLLQWKIIHRIYPSGTVLKRMKLRESEKCNFCPLVDTLTHFFFECSVIKPIWYEVERRIEEKTGSYISINQEIAMFGIDIPIQKDSIYANHLILLAKASISKAKFHGISNRGIIPIFEREMLLRKL